VGANELSKRFDDLQSTGAPCPCQWGGFVDGAASTEFPKLKHGAHSIKPQVFNLVFAAQPRRYRFLLMWVEISPWRYEGQGDFESATGAFDAVDSDCAAMFLDDFERSSEADAATGDPPRHVAAAAIAFKDFGEVFLGDADPFVGNRDRRPVTTWTLVPAERERDRNRAAARTVFDCVRKQIRDDPVQAKRVPIADQRAHWGIDPQRVELGRLLSFGNRLPGQGKEINCLPLQVEVLSSLQPRLVEQLINLGRHPAGGGVDLFETGDEALD
jgi:hypothetical protein